MNVLEGRIVCVFGGEDERSEEDTMQCPIFGLDG